MAETTSPETGSLLSKLRSALPGSRHPSDARLSPVTTFREASTIPAPSVTGDPLTAPGDGNDLAQPGENATELHPDDTRAMAEKEEAQQKRSDYTAQAVLSGTPFSHPVHEPRYPENQAPQTPSDPSGK